MTLNTSRYDHLTECISRVLDERPNNAAGMLRYILYTIKSPCIDLLEDISRTIKKEKLQLKTDTLVVTSCKKNTLIPRTF